MKNYLALPFIMSAVFMSTTAFGENGSCNDKWHESIISSSQVSDVESFCISGVTFFSRDSYLKKRSGLFESLSKIASEELGLTFEIVSDGGSVAILVDDDFVFLKNEQNSEVRTDEQIGSERPKLTEGQKERAYGYVKSGIGAAVGKVVSTAVTKATGSEEIGAATGGIVGKAVIDLMP